jgi:acetyltransferase-like isoleucine patch superfamily enzyme
VHRKIGRFLRARRYARTYRCTVYPSGRIVPSNRQVRDSIVVGANTHIRGELLTFGHGGRIRLGEYCYVGENTRIWSAKEILIGDRVLISHNANIFDNDTHPLSARERHQQFRAIISTGHPTSLDLKEEPVVIRDDVLIGCNSVVLKGVTIGEGAVVGAGSVVTTDVPPWTVVAGNPARVIRELAEDER